MRSHAPLRVLLVIKCLGYGGAERLLVDVVSCASRSDVEYSVAYVLRSEDGLVPAVLATGTRVVPLGATSHWDLRWMKRLRKLLVEGRYDVVHFHLPYAGALGQMVVASLPPRCRPAVVYTQHSLWSHSPLVTKALLRASIGADHHLVAVSQAAHDALPRSLRQRARVLVHGIDLSQARSIAADREALRDEVRAEIGVPDSRLLFLTVANLRPEKGHDVLLEAARMIVDDDVAITFAAVGRGPLKDRLHARHRELTLGEHFKFLGPRDDVLRLLAGADAFVLPSRHEGLPVVLMEAASLGLPIIASAVGGIPETFSDEVDALLVAPGDPRELAKAICRLAGDPALRIRLGAAVMEKSAMFDVSEAARALGDLYRQALRRLPNRFDSLDQSGIS